MTASNHRDWRPEDLSQPQGGAVDPTQTDAHGTDDFRRDYTSQHFLRDHLEKVGANSSELWTCSRLIHEEKPTDFLFFTEITNVCLTLDKRNVFMWTVIFNSGTRNGCLEQHKTVGASICENSNKKQRFLPAWQKQTDSRTCRDFNNSLTVWICSVFQQLSDWTWNLYWKTPPGLHNLSELF